MDDKFLRLTSRLNFIEFCPDYSQNIEVWRYLTIIEDYIYGVRSQYNRIEENISKSQNFNIFINSPMVLTQIRLDVYYYTLTWDKISKIFKKFIDLMNVIQKPNPFSKPFTDEFKIVRRRFIHLLGQFNKDVRNEYEHPSLEPTRINKLIGWGNMFSENNGDLKVHVGKDQISFVQRTHVENLYSIWIDLLDVILKHFSKKPSSRDLIQLKKNIEQNIDEIITEYNIYLKENKMEDASKVLGQFMMVESYLSIEGIPLSQDIINRFHSILFSTPPLSNNL
jgi:hypothetical protein